MKAAIYFYFFKGGQDALNFKPVMLLKGFLPPEFQVSNSVKFMVPSLISSQADPVAYGERAPFTRDR